MREQRRECLTYRRKRGAECRRLLPALTKLAAIDRHDVDDLSSPSLALMHKLALELHNAARSVSETGHEPTNEPTNQSKNEPPCSAVVHPMESVQVRQQKTSRS